METQGTEGGGRAAGLSHLNLPMFVGQREGSLSRRGLAKTIMSAAQHARNITKHRTEHGLGYAEHTTRKGGQNREEQS